MKFSAPGREAWFKTLERPLGFLNTYKKKRWSRHTGKAKRKQKNHTKPVLRSRSPYSLIISRANEYDIKLRYFNQARNTGIWFTPIKNPVNRNTNEFVEHLGAYYEKQSLTINSAQHTSKQHRVDYKDGCNCDNRGEHTSDYWKELKKKRDIKKGKWERQVKKCMANKKRKA